MSLSAEVIWVIVTVAEGGILGLTQQMSKFNDLGSPPRTSLSSPTNPFASSNGEFLLVTPHILWFSRFWEQFKIML